VRDVEGEHRVASDAARVEREDRLPRPRGVASAASILRRPGRLVSSSEPEISMSLNSSAIVSPFALGEGLQLGALGGETHLRRGPWSFGSRWRLRDVNLITLSAIEEWHARLPGDVQANRAFALLSAMFTFALERKIVRVNPCSGFDQMNPETAKEFFYSPEQSKAILAAALAFPDIRGRYIALELLTGVRPNELRDVARSWHTPGAIRTPDHKGRRGHIVRGRTIYLSPPAEAILDNLDALHARPGGAYCYFPEEMDLRRAWERIVKIARVPHARQYDLRHTFASAALATKEVTLDLIGIMLGHRKRETTLRYAHLAPDIGVNAAAAAAARMGA
jgi:integrase